MVWTVKWMISDRDEISRADEFHSTLPGEPGLSVVASQSECRPEEGMGCSVAFLS